MSRGISRRSVLSRLGATGAVFVSGCFGSAYDPPPGSLTLSNRHDQGHSVTVSVTTDGESRCDEFAMPARKERTIEDFIARTGTHTVTAEIETGDRGTIEGETGASPYSSTGLTGYAFRVSVNEDGTLTLSAGVYD